MPHPIITTIHAAIAAGATRDGENECLRVDTVPKSLELVDGEWQLVDGPGHRIRAATWAFIGASTKATGWDDNDGLEVILRVTEEVSWGGYGPFGPQDRSLVSTQIGGLDYAELGWP